MDQRSSVVPLAVADLARSRGFHETLGRQVAGEEDGPAQAVDLLGQSLSLYGRDDLARDMGVDPDRLGAGGTTPVCNVHDAVAPLAADGRFRWHGFDVEQVEGAL